MKQELRELVWLRDQSQCEYCQMPQQFVDLSHGVDLLHTRSLQCSRKGGTICA